MSKSIYGVICPNHGEVELTEEQYTAQMMNPDALWKCPICKFPSDFDQDKWEIGMGYIEVSDE